MFRSDAHKCIVVFVTRKPDEFSCRKMLCEEDILEKAGSENDSGIKVEIVDRILLEYTTSYKAAS